MRRRGDHVKRALLIVIDGAADRALKTLNGKTPLEVAYKPNIDQLATNGVTGIMDPIAPGVSVGSDTAHLALLGYDPFKTYTGRGAFEALGAGIKLQPGEVAFRTNFATVDEEMRVIDRRAGRYIEEAKEFEKLINSISLKTSNVKVLFRHTVEHRGVLILRGEGLSRFVSDTDPHKIGMRVLESKPLIDSPEAKRTANIVNEFTREVYKLLKDHPLNKSRVKRGLPPANILLVRGAGVLPNVKPLSERFKVKCACIAGIALVKGVAKAVGMDIIDVPGATGGLDTDVLAKVKYAIKALEDYDFVFIHYKGTDAASHDGNVWAKVKIIEKIDSAIGYLIDRVNLDETYIIITADHATLTEETRNHSGDFVPILIHGPGVIPDDVRVFCERACLKGGLGRIRGLDLMNIIMNYLDKVEKFGE